MSGFISWCANTVRVTVETCANAARDTIIETPEARRNREELIACAKMTQVAAGITAIALTILFATTFPTLIGMALYLPSLYLLYEVAMVSKNIQELAQDGVTYCKAFVGLSVEETVKSKLSQNTLLAKAIIRLNS